MVAVWIEKQMDRFKRYLERSGKIGKIKNDDQD